MTDSESGEDAQFMTDCVTSGTEGGDGSAGGRTRQSSVPEMLQRSAALRKRRTPCRGPRSPQDEPLPGAKRPAAGQPAWSGEMSAALTTIQGMIDAGIGKVIASFEARFGNLERRLDMMESENMDKDMEIKQLKEQVGLQERSIKELHDRLEGLDANRRISTLILACDDFNGREQGEDVEEMVVQALSRRYPKLKVSSQDIQDAHRLQANNKIIVKFVKRKVRDAVYEGRFDMVGGGGGLRRADRGAERLAPLFVTESLVASQSAIYQELLRARKPENGQIVASVFSRRGVVWCRKARGGANLRVPDEQHLRRILGGARFPPVVGGVPGPASRPPGRRGGWPAGGGARSRRGGPPPGPAPPGAPNGGRSAPMVGRPPSASGTDGPSPAGDETPPGLEGAPAVDGRTGDPDTGMRNAGSGDT